MKKFLVAIVALFVVAGAIWYAANRDRGKLAAVSEVGEIGKSIAQPALPEPTPTPPPSVVMPDSTPTAEPVAESPAPASRAAGPHVLVLTGRVKLESGEPAPGAQIIVRKYQPTADPGEDFITRTDGSGRFRIEAEDASMHQIRVEKQGYATIVKVVFNNVWYRNGRQETSRRELAEDFVLVPEAIVAGRVTGPTGEAIPGATIKAVWPALSDGTFPGNQYLVEVETQSGEDGAFTLRGAAGGAIRLMASADGYVSRIDEITAPAEGLELRLEAGGAEIHGIVTRLETGDAIGSATLRLRMATSNGRPVPRELARELIATSGADGEFSFRNLAPGDYYIQGEKGPLRTFRFNSPSEITLDALDSRATVAITLYAGHSLRGRVTERGTENPVPGATVIAGPQVPGQRTPEDITDAEGYYRITGIFAKNVYISASADGWATPQTENYSIFGNAISLQADKLELTHNIELVRTLTVSGRVQFPDGRPCTTAVVSNFGLVQFSGKSSTRVDNDGRFQLEAHPNTTVILAAEVPDYGTRYSPPIDVILDSVEGVVITISDPASVVGIATDANGNPLEGVEVKAKITVPIDRMGLPNALNDAGTQITGADGRFAFPRLAPGAYVFTGSKEGYASARIASVKLVSGPNPDLTLKLGEAHFVAGIVVDEEDRPLPGINLQIFQPGRAVANMVTTDTDGRFRQGELSEGRVDLIIGLMNSRQEMFQDVRLDDPDQKFVLKKKETITLIATVIDAETKEPITDFTVRSTLGNPSRPQLDPERPGGFIWEGLTLNQYQSATIEANGYPVFETGPIELKPGEPEVHRTFEIGRGGALAGRLIDKSTHEPVPGANIVVLRRNNRVSPFNSNIPLASVKSDENGRFELKPLPAEGLTLRASLRGVYADKALNVSVENGKTTNLGDIELDGGRTITVIAVEPDYGRPVPNVRISLSTKSGSAAQTLDTDANGRAIFTGVAEEEATLNLSLVNVTVPLTPNDIEMRVVVGRTTLRGNILKAGQPVSAIVSASTGIQGAEYILPPQRVDTDGKFEVTGMVPGNWRFEILDLGQPGRQQPYYVDVPNQPLFEHTFELPAATIRGIVKNDAGKPVPGARVTFIKPGDQLGTRFNKTDAEGRFAFESIAPGEYSISAEETEFGAATQTVQIVGEETKEIELVLARQGGTLVSTALNYEDSQPMRQAWCKLTDMNGVEFAHSTQRGADGVMTIKFIPPGTYRVEVSAWDYSEAHHTVEIREGETVTIEDVLFAAGTLHWRLLDNTGKPHVGVPYRVTPLDPQSLQDPIEGVTDKDGDAYVRGVWPGMYRAQATINGQTIERDFMLEKLGTLKEITTVP